MFFWVSVDFQVQAVLLLLGGYEVPAGIPTVNMASQSHRVCIFTPSCSVLLLHWFAIIYGSYLAISLGFK